MIHSFSGDHFLAHRAARKTLREAGLGAEDVVEMSEDIEPDDIIRRASQGGLFGRVGLLLDFDAAFTGKAGVKPRNDAIEALRQVPPDAFVVVVDLTASASRQKRYAELGSHQHLPTPKYGALIAWVRQELQQSGVSFDRDVPEALADLFGEDLPGIVGEIAKLQLLGENFTAERVRQVAGRLPVRDAFHLVDAIIAGDEVKALSVCGSLVDQGEAPAKVMGALTWQFELVARCVAIREEGRPPGDAQLAGMLGVKPYAAKKAMSVAARLDEPALAVVLGRLLEADRAVKSGRDENWALESLALELAGYFAAKGAVAAGLRR